MSHEDLDATVWMQTSAEYPAIAEQTYRLATLRLPEAWNDPTWSAWPPQANQLQDAAKRGENLDNDRLPPAVVLDVDETVLDNSGYQAKLIQIDGEYDPQMWNAWVTREQARAVPGAKSFLDACRARGIAIYFVTNREYSVESSTRHNLEALELRDADNPEDNILSKRELPTWGSDKTPRREWIARDHRVLLLIGDDLNDFIDIGYQPTAADRRQLAAQYTEYWGTQWFLLPNPNYGSWERSLYNFDDAAPRDSKLQRKRDHLWTGE